jgi:hypothetical protein
MFRVLRVLLLNEHHDITEGGMHVIPRKQMDVALDRIEIIVEMAPVARGSTGRLLLFLVACFLEFQDPHQHHLAFV